MEKTCPSQGCHRQGISPMVWGYQPLILQTEGLSAYGGVGLSMGRRGRTFWDCTKLAAGLVRERLKVGTERDGGSLGKQVLENRGEENKKGWLYGMKLLVCPCA